MNRLHRVFNKDPQPYQVMFVSSTVGGVLDINADGLTITHRYATVRVDFGEKTLNQVMVEINNKPYLTATLRQPTYSSMLAKGLLPSSQQDLEDGRIYMASSIFHNEMQVYSGQLQQQADMLEDGEKQLYFHSATGEWLDYWAREYFGNPRKQQEFDNQYMPRVVAEIIKINQNNKALEIIFNQAFLFTETKVLDAPPDIFPDRDYYGNFKIRFFDQLGITRNDWLKIASVANKSKSAGTRPYFELNTTTNGNIYHACAVVQGQVITILPWNAEEIQIAGTIHRAIAYQYIQITEVRPQ